MGNLYEMFETNKVDEIDGKWYTLGSTRINIARSGGRNTRYSKIFQNVSKKYNIDSDNIKDLEESRANAFMIEVFVKAVVKGWEVKEGDEWVPGILLKDGKEGFKIVEFNTKNAIKILVDLPDLHTKLSTFSSDMKNYLQEQQEKDLKN